MVEGIKYLHNPNGVLRMICKIVNKGFLGRTLFSFLMAPILLLAFVIISLIC